MTAAADKLRLDRLDGDTVSVGCLNCPLLAQCGGYTRRGGGWSCMDRCADCDKAKCSVVCLKKPDFARGLLEIGGFDHRGIPAVRQPSDALPRYAPVIQRPIDGTVHLEWVAIPLTEIMRFDRGQYLPRANTGAELRAAFGLAPSTKIILLGTGKDRGIETYWRLHRKSNVAEALARLDIAAGIVPNYSMFLEDPRPQHMHNRKRSLLVAKDWTNAGIPTVIFMQAVAPADWRYWESFLVAHPEVVHIAQEFQTGLANPDRANFAFDNLTRIQDRIGRRLHLFAIGATRYRAEIPRRFDGWSLIDSMPFMKAISRRVASSTGRRITWRPALGENVSDLLVHNVSRYRDWLER